MEEILIEALEKVAQDLTKAAEQKKKWGHLGNSYGRSECKKLLEFEAKILMAIANEI